MNESANPTARRICLAAGCGEPAVEGRDDIQYMTVADEAGMAVLDGFCVRHRWALCQMWVGDYPYWLYSDAFDRDRRLLV